MRPDTLLQVPSIALEGGTASEFQLTSDWLRIERASEYSQLPRTTLYEILDDPKSGLVSFSLKLRKGQKRGIRFILRQSLDRYLDRRAAEQGAHRSSVKPKLTHSLIKNP